MTVFILTVYIGRHFPYHATLGTSYTIRLGVTLNTASDYRPLSDYQLTILYYWTYRLLTVSVPWVPSVDSAYSAESTLFSWMALWSSSAAVSWIAKQNQCASVMCCFHPLVLLKTSTIFCFRRTYSQCVIGRFSWITWIDRWQSWLKTFLCRNSFHWLCFHGHLTH